jgi:hypothetical protein
MPINRNTAINFATSPVKRVSVNYANNVSPRSIVPQQEGGIMMSRSNNQMITTQVVSSPRNQVNFQIKPRAYDSSSPSVTFQKSQQPIVNRMSSPNHSIPNNRQQISQARNTIDWDSTFGGEFRTQQSTNQPRPQVSQ